MEIRTSFLGEYQVVRSHYSCYMVSRNKGMVIKAEVMNEGNVMGEVTVYPFYMKEYSLLVEKKVDGELVDNAEFVCGISSGSAKKAYNIISRSGVSFTHIEDVLSENGLPYIKGFMDSAISAIKNAIKHNHPELVEYAYKRDGLRISLKVFNTPDPDQAEDYIPKIEAAAAKQ
ncbi:MAG TPA: hypothetical protein VK190_03375 [Pseudoneobacillus sp.]|nr:hypothetical protein [Pseudoneobacillus sp.]